MSIRRIVLCLMMALLPSAAGAQYGNESEPDNRDSRYPGARAENGPPPRVLIHNPTASTLPKGHFDAFVWVSGNGGLLAGTSMGFTNRFLVGVSYGAEGFLGTGEPVWNDRVSFQVKLQLLPEHLKFPAVTLGYDDQGHGPYLAAYDRYTLKSKGVYGVVTKNFYTLSVATGFHGGVNYSFETQDGEKEPDVFFGWDLHYNQEWSLLLEYTLGLNDNQPGSPVGKGRGYLNLGLRWEYSRELVMEAIITDLTQNRKDVEQIGRELRIVYLQEF